MPHPDLTRVDGAGSERPTMSDARQLSLEVMRLYDLAVLHDRLYEVAHRDFLWAVACELQHFDKCASAARADARLGRALRRLFDREGLAVLAAPYDAPGVRITGCGTVVEGETLEAAVAALDAQLEARAAKEADDGE